MTCTEQQTDWEGSLVPENEPDDKKILVWEVDPHPSNSDYDVLWERSWQRMLEIVSNSLETHMERFTPEELREGVSIKFKLVEMTVGEWRKLR